MAKSPIKVLHDRIAVLPESIETKTAGGIIIPDTATNKPNRGKVVSAGPKSSLKEGETVLFQKGVGVKTGIEQDGKELLIMQDYDVLAII